MMSQNRIIVPTKDIRIPEELQEQKRWCLVRVRWDNQRGIWRKEHYFDPSGAIARNNDPDSWHVWREILRHVDQPRGVYPVFTFQSDDAWVFTDLDRCFDAGGKLYPWAKAYIRSLPPVWWEYSLSGRGLHAVTLGSCVSGSRVMPGDAEDKAPKLELYQGAARFCIVTGKPYKPKKNPLRLVDAGEQRLPGEPKALTAPVEGAQWLWDGTSEVLDKKALKQAVSALTTDVRALYKKGDASPWYRNNPDASQAQYAVCAGLAAALQGDRAAVDYAYMQSPVCRLYSNQKDGKGRSAAYRKQLIEKVCREWEAARDKDAKQYQAWAQIKAPAVMVERGTGRVLTSTEFNKWFSPRYLNGKDSAFVRFQSMERCIRADGMAFVPGAEELTTLDSIPGDVLNTWRKKTINALPGDLKPWFELVEQVLADERVRERVLDWVAATAVGLKVCYMPIIGSVPGVGKDLMLVPLKNAIAKGQFNDNVTVRDLLGDKQDWLWQKQGVIVQEIRAFKNADFENMLKTYVMAPPDDVSIDLKYGKRFHTPNVCNFFGTTNHQAMVRVAVGERRMLIYWSHAEEMSARIGAERTWWYANNYLQKDETAAALQMWAEERIKGDIKTHLLPDEIMTEHKAVIAEASKNPLAEVLEHEIAEYRGPFVRDVIAAGDIIPYVKERGWSGRGQLSSQRIVLMLKENGVDVGFREGTVMFPKGMAKQRYVIVRSVDKWMKKPLQKLREEATRRVV